MIIGRIRGIILDVFLGIWTALVAIMALPFGFFPRTARGVYRLWAQGALLLARLITGISYQIKEVDIFPKNEPFILLSKHHSMWETIAFLTVFDKPSYILKKELLSIPFYGWYLKAMGMIPIDRKGGVRSLKDVIKEAEVKLKSKHQVIIFPQGTRVPVHCSVEDYPYYFSIIKLYDQGYRFFVAGLNSGLYWPKGACSAKKSGTIILEAKEIPLNLSVTELKNFIKNNIEEISNRLSQSTS